MIKVNEVLQEYRRIFPHTLRIALGLMLMLYGISKIIGLQFHDGTQHFDRPVKDLNGMQMVWTFFAFSRGYAFSVGIVQVVASLLLLLRRTAAIGAIVYMTVMVNVVLIDLWYDVNRQATGMACTLLLGVLLWMCLERHRYFAVLDKLLVSSEEISKPVHHNCVLVPVLSLVLLCIMVLIVSLLTNPVNGPLG